MIRRLGVLTLEVILFAFALLGQQPAWHEPPADYGCENRCRDRRLPACTLEDRTGRWFHSTPRSIRCFIICFVDYLDPGRFHRSSATRTRWYSADLSIRGSTFEQALVLLNGLRINDAQSGHRQYGYPIPLDATSRIEVLHGTGSTFYGSDAIAEL